MTARLYAIALATIAVVVACDRVPLTSPTGSTIVLTADHSVLPLGGETRVHAVVTESAGTPVHNGTVVTFQTTVGSFVTPEAQTVNGIATTTFRAGPMSGTAQINAFSGGARTGSGNSSAGGVQVKIGAAAAAGTISMSATPSSVSQSGGVVTISALVFDDANNPLPGVNVQFVASTGSLTATTATTDSNGIARTQLSTAQSATVTAFAGAAKGEVRVEASAAPGVAIQASDGIVGVPVAISVTFSGGTSTNSSPRQIASLRVDFGDGTSETRFNVTGAAAFTHTYTRAGGYVLTATAVDVAGNTGIASDVITIANAALPTATITASPQTGTAPQNVTFTVTGSAAPNGGAPITSLRAFINGEQVFQSSGGQGTFAHRFTTPGNYVATVVVTDANGNEGRSQTTVIIQ